MRTSGRPSSSTVASASAVGSLGSCAVASASQSAKSANGSPLAPKSPAVNPLSSMIAIHSSRSGGDCALAPQAQEPTLSFACTRLGAAIFCGVLLAGCAKGIDLDRMGIDRTIVTSSTTSTAQDEAASD